MTISHSDPPGPYQPYALSQDKFIFGFDTTAYVSVTKPELSVNHFKSFPYVNKNHLTIAQIIYQHDLQIFQYKQSSN